MLEPLLDDEEELEVLTEDELEELPLEDVRVTAAVELEGEGEEVPEFERETVPELPDLDDDSVAVPGLVTEPLEVRVTAPERVTASVPERVVEYPERVILLPDVRDTSLP